MSLTDWRAPGSPAIEKAIRRACSPGYESWWARCTSVGFCANPIQATAHDPDTGRRVPVLIRCGNRRAAICPSCSDLYAADTWQLVHAGTHGGHHGMPETTAQLPQVFATLTAPSFGAVHTSSHRTGLRTESVCHPRGSRNTHCPHGKPLWCNVVHRHDDAEVGQPLCAECYDYIGHVLFNWHAPELWRRFTIALRRAVTAHLRRVGVDPAAVRVSFVKVAEYQRRAVIHYHTLIRLDPTGDPQPTISTIDLDTLVRQAANQVRLPVNVDDPADPGMTASPEREARMLRFGPQIDTQPLIAADDDAKPGLARRVAAYLAKYTTKSVAEFGIAARRISPAAIGELDIPTHTRRILTALVKLAARPGNAAMLAWLHTLGYRGHVTTKSRRYSVTMTALRAARHHWRVRRNHEVEPVDLQGDSPAGLDFTSTAGELSDWRIDGAGLRDDGERLLVLTAALRAQEHRYLARLDDGDRDNELLPADSADSEPYPRKPLRNSKCVSNEDRK
ncbi:replication initiator [Mycobacterium shimoidei]|uniref:replication initiator n=1 Tax=Mycobacterium shimoidei TaxID=29313 RepID=UPI00111C35C6|nr:replication initiator [Mycobacterium shimoidei]MCV7258373.1 plasmid replication initiator protein [Mycobacterium shimoidei]